MKNDYPELSAKIDKAINFFVDDLGTIRAGRASTTVLNKISVDYYGTMTPIPQVAAVATPDARTITIQPWDATLIKEIEKAILASELGINPQNDGKMIRLSFPQLTEDRRKELTKSVAKKSEDCKVVVRGIRRDEIEKFKALREGTAKAIPAWLELNSAELSGKVVELPKREDIDLSIEEHLIVELYSR